MIWHMLDGLFDSTLATNKKIDIFGEKYLLYFLALETIAPTFNVS